MVKAPLNSLNSNLNSKQIPLFCLWTDHFKLLNSRNVFSPVIQ